MYAYALVLLLPSAVNKVQEELKDSSWICILNPLSDIKILVN